MIKKPYLRPTAKLVEVKIVQLVCASPSGVNSTGLDENEKLNYGEDYGEGKTTKKNAWENAW